MSQKISEMDAADTLTGTEIVPVVQSGGNKQTTVADIVALAGGADPIALESTVWVETTGDDGTAVVGDPAHPFATIDAALDALTSGGVIYLGRGRHAPITSDIVSPWSSLNGSSKLKNNLLFVGAGRPSLDSETAPTTLDANTGTVIDGPIYVHSTRNRVRFKSLGVDSGSAVTTARYSGTSVDGLAFLNVGQVGSLAQSKDCGAQDVIALCRAATSLVHAMLFENVASPVIENVVCIFGVHGFAYKGVYGRVRSVISKGHQNSCVIIKESNTNNDTAPCHDNVMSDIIMGNVSGSDTPVGAILETASTRPMERLSISGLNSVGVGSLDLNINTTASSGTPGLVRKVRIDGFNTDAAALRISVEAGSAERSSIYINGQALATSSGLDAYDTNLWAAGGIRRLLSAWSGALIRVRRSSDNAEMDVGYGYDYGVDVGAILAWSGADSVYVTTVYDQTGNGRHVVQATGSKQPILVNAGAYLGSMQLDGTDDTMVTNTTTPTGATLSIGLRYQFRSLPSSPNSVNPFGHNNLGVAAHNAALFQYQGNDANTHTYAFNGTSTYQDVRYASPALVEVGDLVAYNFAASGASKAILYRDGAAASVVGSGSSGTPSSNFTAETLFFGSNQDAAGWCAMNLKTFAIWITAETANGAAISGAL